MTAEIGGLPAEGVQKTFMQAQDAFTRCFHAGIARVRYMGGDLKFWVKVDQQGSFVHAHLEHSELGDRKTEQCLLDALMKYRWPTPVGGQVGVATFSMGFDHAPDVPPPIAWGADRVTETLQTIEAQVDDCRMGLPGTFSATVYVERHRIEPTADAGAEPKLVGRALAASATPPDEAAEMAVDCVAKVLLEAAWPDPGDRPVKIRFGL